MAQHNPLDIDAQERALEEQREKAILSAQTEIGDLNWVMSNKRGRRFVARLLDRAGVWRTSFSTNALSMAFSEGTRNEGLTLIDQLMTHCPEKFFDMLKEFKS